MGITVELARKCRTLTDKAYPLRVPGNPAAGREHGTAKEVRDYFKKCVANKGNMGGRQQTKLQTVAHSAVLPQAARADRAI
jgi:hypothetical protein